MGDFEQSLRDQFGSERNQRIAALEAELAAERERAERMKRERDNWVETANQYARNTAYYRGLVISIGEMFGEVAKTADDGTVMEDVLCAKVPDLVVAERTARRDAEAELARIDKAMDDVDLPTDQDDFRLTRAGRLAALKDWWQDYAECTQKAISRAETAEAQVVALREALVSAKWLLCTPGLIIGKKEQQQWEQHWHVFREALSQPSPAVERIQALEKADANLAVDDHMEQLEVEVEKLRDRVHALEALAEAVGDWVAAYDSDEGRFYGEQTMREVEAAGAVHDAFDAVQAVKDE